MLQEEQNNEPSTSDNEELKNNEFNVSKSELKKIETEKRIKRIHELMEFIDKANEEIQIYQEELWDLLKIQIKIPQKRERKVNKEKEKEKDIDKEKVDGNDIDNNKKEKKVVQLSSFDRFFKPKINKEQSDTLPQKQRPRAISFEECVKKDRMDNFEIIDIFQINGIQHEFVRDCLEKCDTNGDMKLFKRIFIKNIPKEEQILRFTGGKNYQVKRNDMWIDDLNGNYIKHVIRKIFENSYMVANDYDYYSQKNIDQFLINQEHITQFDDDKYIEKLMGLITSSIDIKDNNFK